ncbi:nonribosomal peptide synthetase 12 [Pyrrhoderma noxium]|uniref:Nonribosomal peptide synthetase 12 n=1 Tax=Pyrrhoderma noxium TaxID=2282107 RepID=A0A286UBE1_9AGAM|nr:nonribosomal peptide synthetase 12 [Pyrrhoderma noxium]
MQLNTNALQSLTPEDQELFVKFGCSEEIIPPFSCVHHAFEFHANADPDAIAVEHLEDSITYKELNFQSNALAYVLRNLGIKPGSRSTLDFILEDSGSAVVLCMKEFSHRVSGSEGVGLCSQDDATKRSILVLEEVLEKTKTSEWRENKPPDLSSPDDGVYVIYTSGTTGKPKGVDVMHRNVTNLVCLKPGNVGMAPGKRVAQLLNVAFDMCAWEVLGSLSNGCTLCIRGKTSKEWRAVMKTVDIIIATPSIIAKHDPKDYPNVKYVATAVLADQWGQSAQFYNSCGPTEITIVNTVHPHVSGRPLSIGRPTPNNTVYILNEDLNPVRIGEPGVMWAGGAGTTRGYVNLPEKTRERYRLDPFLNNGSYMFNTGDLGKWRMDGQLDHLGRTDDQVKVKGFRVELDGVAAAMETCHGVKSATVLLIQDELWGFISSEKVEIDDVRSTTAKIQPYYAVPTHFHVLSEFPLTSNGKVDKRALRQVAEEYISRLEKSLVLQPSKKANIMERSESTFSSILQYGEGVNWAETATLPAAPPPVYQKNPDPSTACVSSRSSSTHLDEKLRTPDMEKGYALAWEGYENDELPGKEQGHYLRNLRHQIFTLYRRLFGVVFIANVATLIVTLAQKSYNSQTLGKIVVANLFCAVLMRQDYVINAFFNVCCAVPTSWPLCIRRVCARVYHIGGLHSGCAISGLVWLIFFTVQATLELLSGGKCSAATLAVTYFILALILAIAAFAWPRFRLIAHDRFERTHRFMGWTTVALVWAQVVLLTNDYRAVGQTLGHALLTSAPFWLLVVLTMSIILPWVRLRKVPVRAEVLSNHAARLYFDYVTPVPGTFTRISESPLFEWHGFATVPEPGKKGYSLVVSRAGDWTSRQIENPPTHLWVRGIPTCGVLRIVPLFRRLVFVATGSGIGPCAPCILEKRVPIRLLWTSPNIRKTFGDKLVDSILEASPGAVVYDTRKYGKPDMVKLTYRLVREFNAEAVCIISNQKLTRKVVYGMVSRGIPAFGAIWDS